MGFSESGGKRWGGGGGLFPWVFPKAAVNVGVGGLFPWVFPKAAVNVGGGGGVISVGFSESGGKRWGGGFISVGFSQSGGKHFFGGGGLYRVVQLYESTLILRFYIILHFKKS